MRSITLLKQDFCNREQPKNPHRCRDLVPWSPKHFWEVHYMTSQWFLLMSDILLRFTWICQNLKFIPYWNLMQSTYFTSGVDQNPSMAFFFPIFVYYYYFVIYSTCAYFYPVVMLGRATQFLIFTNLGLFPNATKVYLLK